MIRPAGEADNAQIAAIWNLEAIGTTATTDTEPRGAPAQLLHVLDPRLELAKGARGVRQEDLAGARRKGALADPLE